MDTNSNFVSLTDDTLFKEIFGREKNAFILEHFLELYFHLKPGELKGKLKYQMECTLEKGKYRDKNYILYIKDLWNSVRYGSGV